MHKKENGQIVVIALLVMVVVMAIALAVVGRSLLNLSMSSKTEESSRAFSAAEAGIEKSLQVSDSGGTYQENNNLFFDNNSQATYDINGVLPDPGFALEHPPIGKDSFAQFWLSDPNNPNNPVYQTSNFDIYFGEGKTATGAWVDYSSNPDNAPAVEVMVVYKDNDGSIKSQRYLYDSYSGVGKRVTDSKEQLQPCSKKGPSVGGIVTNKAGNPTRYFYCQATVPPSGSLPGQFPIMVRVRILYSSLSHPIAIKPNNGQSLPKQATLSKSTGTVGNVQRTLEVFEQKTVMPQFLDYALFSAGTLDRQ